MTPSSLFDGCGIAFVVCIIIAGLPVLGGLLYPDFPDEE